MSGKIADEVCIVTGAARNIGRAIAERLGDEGARVVGVDGLVNNVAHAENKSILDCTEEDWDRVMTSH